jgi:hypothetical protein
MLYIVQCNFKRLVWENGVIMCQEDLLLEAARQIWTETENLLAEVSKFMPLTSLVRYRVELRGYDPRVSSYPKEGDSIRVSVFNNPGLNIEGERALLGRYSDMFVRLWDVAVRANKRLGSVTIYPLGHQIYKPGVVFYDGVLDQYTYWAEQDRMAT